MNAVATVAACIRRDWWIDLSYRFAYALELVSLLFTLVLFYYLARIVDSSSLPASSGLNHGYFGFAAVGLALARILYVALSTFATQLREDQTTGTFETLVATPTSRSVLILGTGAYDLLRGTVSGVVMIAAAAAFFDLHLDAGLDSAAVVGAGLVGCLVLFCALGVAVAAFTVVFKQTTAVLALVTTGIAVLGGVYFPIQLLPGPVEFLAHLSPFTWGLDVLRASLLSGQRDLEHLGLLLAFDAFALPGALLLFNLALRRARRTGSVAHY